MNLVQKVWKIVVQVASERVVIIHNFHLLKKKKKREINLFSFSSFIDHQIKN